MLCSVSLILSLSLPLSLSFSPSCSLPLSHSLSLSLPISLPLYLPPSLSPWSRAQLPTQPLLPPPLAPVPQQHLCPLRPHQGRHKQVHSRTHAVYADTHTHTHTHTRTHTHTHTHKCFSTSRCDTD